MEISALQPHLKASDVPFDQLAGNPNIAEGDKVKEAARQFEAVLLRQILAEGRKTVISSSQSDDSNETSIYNDMINNQMADSISKSGAFGLAKSIEGQLVRQTLPKAGGLTQGENTTTPTAVTATHHHS